MGNRSWTVVGVLLTMAMINLSGFINYSFGYSLGTTERVWCAGQDKTANSYVIEIAI